MSSLFNYLCRIVLCKTLGETLKPMKVSKDGEMHHASNTYQSNPKRQQGDYFYEANS